MSQQYDTAGLHSFILNTPEGGLRKLLVDNKPMTEAHFNLMLKIARACSEEQFGVHFTAQDFPKVKMGPADIKIREKFWNDCMQTWEQRGLLNPAVATKAA